MSNKADRRRRKMEARAARKEKRQLRHADEKLQEQEELAAVMDEHDDTLNEVDAGIQHEVVVEPDAIGPGDFDPDVVGMESVPETDLDVPVMESDEVFVDEDLEPEATEPEATEPEATEPEATEPEATEPEATEPEATEPEAVMEPDEVFVDDGDASVELVGADEAGEPEESVAVVTTGNYGYEDIEDPFAYDDEVPVSGQAHEFRDPMMFVSQMSDEELDAELGGFEPSDGSEPVVNESDESEDEPDSIETYDDSSETEALTDEAVMKEESAGRVLLTSFDDLEDPFEDAAGIVVRSEDIGSGFKEYDSGQEFEQPDYSADFEEDDYDRDFEEDANDQDLDFVTEREADHVHDFEYMSESEAVRNDAEIIEDVVEQAEASGDTDPDDGDATGEPDGGRKRKRGKKEKAKKPKKEKKSRKSRKARDESEPEVSVEDDSIVFEDDLPSVAEGDVFIDDDDNASESGNEASDGGDGTGPVEEDGKPVRIKLTWKEKKEQRKRDLEALKADKKAYKEFRRAGGKGRLVRDFVPPVADGVPAGAEATEANAPVAEQPAIPKRKSNKRNGMASVMRESVVEAVWPDFLDNDHFLVERNGEQWGTGLFLDTATVGGFNRKSKNDEAKGGILEALSSGLLKHLVTEELMDGECIVLIPCVESMSVIDEYMLLYNAEYTLCYVNSDGQVELTNLPIKASEVDAILSENGYVSDWIRERTPQDELEEQALEEVLEQDEEPVEDEMEQVPVRSDDDFIEDAYDEYAENADPYADMHDDPNDEIGYDDTADLEAYEDVGEYEQASEADEDDIISYDAVNDTIVRVFYSGDLCLEVSTEPFDSLFIHKNAYVPFQENRIEQFDKDDTFLGQAVTEMVKDYNTQLEGMHTSNIQKLRSDYYTLANLACSRIAEKYDLDNPNTEVGQSKIALDADYSLKLASQEERSHQETNRINMEWQETLKKVGEAAAEKARASYTDRFLRAHNDDLAHVMPNIKLADETDYKTRLQELHDMRRQNAKDDLDKFVNEIVAKLTEKYRVMMDEEEAARNAWADELRAYVDEHRKDEFARAAALAERQRQRSEADMVRSEMIGTVNKMRSEFETSQANWTTQMQRMQAEHDEELRAKDQLRENKIAEMADEQSRLNGVIDDLNHQLETIDDVKTREYKSSLTQAQNEAMSWKAEMEHQRMIHKRRNIISATIAIIAVLAALSVGFIGGAYVNLKADRTKSAQAIVNQIDERLEENNLIESNSAVEQADEPMDGVTSSTVESSTIDEGVSSDASDTDSVSDVDPGESEAGSAESGSDDVDVVSSVVEE